MKINPAVMQEFLEIFTRELERWCSDNSLTLVKIEMTRDAEEDDDNEECFVIDGLVEHTISMQNKSFKVGFGKRYKASIPDDVFPTLTKVENALRKAYWPTKYES